MPHALSYKCILPCGAQGHNNSNLRRSLNRPHTMLQVCHSGKLTLECKPPTNLVSGAAKCDVFEGSKKITTYSCPLRVCCHSWPNMPWSLVALGALQLSSTYHADDLVVALGPVYSSREERHQLASQASVPSMPTRMQAGEDACEQSIIANLPNEYKQQIKGELIFPDFNDGEPDAKL